MFGSFPSFLILIAFVLVSGTHALIYGVDSSGAVSVATFSQARKDGFTKAVIEGYTEACAIGGEVNPSFLFSYDNARAAGYTNIDTYWFPCTGANTCKPFDSQIAALGEILSVHRMAIGRIWIYFKVDSNPNGCPGNWDLGYEENLAQAMEIILAIKTNGYAYGIYSSSVDWKNIFGSYSVVLDNTAPLWFADYNLDETLTPPTPFGGWTSAVGHQYTNISASGDFNLNVFAQ